MADGPFTAAIRQAIRASGRSFAEIERATGVQRASLSRFVRGERTLRLDMADRLARHFGLTVTPGSPKD